MMKTLICLLFSMSLTPSARAAAHSALAQITLPEYDAINIVPRRIDAVFPEDAPRAGSLYGATFRWERDQLAAWTGGIPGLSSYEARGGCGPIAAEAMLRFMKGDPKLNKIREIFDIAERKGYWSGGMHGPASEKKLLAELGVRVSDPIWSGDLYRLIRESLDRGKPVIISTNSHYFFAEGYNNNGLLFVGYTGSVMRCGAAQMSLGWISQCGGGGVALLIPE